VSGFPSTQDGSRSRLPRSRFCRQRGFSLAELVVTASVMAILALLAVQAHQVVLREMACAQLNDLMAAFSYARSTAIKTNRTITICKSSDGMHCGRGAAWNDGWITFIDRNRDRIIDPEDQLLRVHKALPKGDRVHDGSGYFYYVMYKPDGSGWPNASFTFCGPAGYRRAVILFYTGRARVSAVASNGKKLDCGVS